MTTEKQIQQLVIDRSQQHSSSKFTFLTIFSLILVSVVLFWLYPFVNASSSDSINNHNIEQANTSDPVSSLPQATDSKHLSVNKSADKGSTHRNISVLDESGHVVARRIATVSSRVTGKLEKLNIEEGVGVKQ